MSVDVSDVHKHRYGPLNRQDCMSFKWKGMFKLSGPEVQATTICHNDSHSQSVQRFLSQTADISLQKQATAAPLYNRHKLQLVNQDKREPRGSTWVSRDSA